MNATSPMTAVIETSVEVGSSKNRNYQAPLDYLRALAALTVVIYHVTITYRGYNNPPPDWITKTWPLFWNPILVYFVEGHTAVTLFMVLSGYVLTKGVVGRQISYWNFIVNRILRIFPLYVFVMIYGISIHPENFNLTSMFQTILPLANYPGSINSEVLTALYWSVAVEFQFYFLFPFMKTFIEKYGIGFGFKLIFLFFTFRILAFAFKVDMQHFAYVTAFGRMDQFIIGMMLAFTPMPRWLSGKTALPLSACAMMILLLAFHRLGGYPNYPWWKPAWPFVEASGWALVIATSTSSPYRMPRPIAAALVFVANMSFSIYVLHSTILQILGERHLYVQFTTMIYPNALLNSLIFLPPVLLLCWLTYSVIEKPFMDLRRRYVEN